MKQLFDIGGVFAYLSLLTVGGGMAAFPELKELTVNTYHWLTFPELLHYYSLGQLAPGPNMMMVAAVGAHVAGLPGAAIALVCFLLPTGLFTSVVGRCGIAPPTGRGGPRSSAASARSPSAWSWPARSSWRGARSPTPLHRARCGVFGLLMRTKINPALPILASGAIGLAAYLL